MNYRKELHRLRGEELLRQFVVIDGYSALLELS